MKLYLTLLILILFTSNCSLNKVEKKHGVPFLEKKNEKLAINKSNKNDIINIMGYPSTKSFFDNDIWIYIENKSTKSSLIKLGKTKYIKNNELLKLLTFLFHKIFSNWAKNIDQFSSFCTNRSV